MTIALVKQANNSQGSGTSLMASLVGSPAAGNALVAFIASNAAAVTGVSGGGVTWAKANPNQWDFYDCEIWYGLNSSGSGTDITATFGSSTRGLIVVAEFSGIKTSSGLDSATNDASGTSALPSPGAIDATASPCLYLAMAACNNSTFPGTVGGGITALTQPTPGGGALSMLAGYKIDNAGHAAITATFDLAGSAAWDSSGIVLLGAASADVTVALSPVVLTLYAPQGESVSSSSGTGSYLRRRLLHRR